MLQRVTVTVRTTGLGPDGAQDTPVLHTVPGTLETAEDASVLRYEEPRELGMAGVSTRCAIRPGRIELRRSGAVTMRAVFEEGRVDESVYALAEGELPMRVETERLRVRLTGRGGLIELRYRLELGGMPMGQKQIRIRMEAME